MNRIPSTNTANGGTFSLTFRASDGVNIATAVSEFTLQFIVQNSNYTSALITTNGSTGTNSTFTDSSSSSQSLTVYGNTTQTSFSPYRSGGYSTYFDGSGDYLSVPNATSLQLGNSDFTIEAWIYPTAIDSGGVSVIMGKYAPSPNLEWFLGFTSSVLRIRYSVNGTSVVGNIDVSYAVSLNTWTHIAVSRTGNNLKFFADGVQIGSDVAFSSTFYQGTGAFGISNANNDNTTRFIGNITDLRVVKGTAVYTAAFTPPTERLTAITNTSLLACHLPYFADGSTNNHTITPNGNAATKPFGPYDYQEYTVGDHGGSAYFDGTGDYIQVGTNVLPAAYDTDWTVEFWMYPSTMADRGDIFSQYSASTVGRMAINTQTDNTIKFFQNGLSPAPLSSAANIYANQWYHVAVVNSSGTRTLYVNGKSQGTATGTSNMDTTNTQVGQTPGQDNFEGNISDLRVVNGTAVYTADFTPPTAPLSAVTNTNLFIKGQDAVIRDKSQACQFVKLGGGSTGSTTQYKYLPSSIQLTGTDPNVQVELPEALGSVFTMEGWFYVTNYNTYGGFFSGSNNNTNSNAKGISVAYDFIKSDAQTTMINWNTTRPTNTWVHIAVTSDGTTLRAFVDGTLQTDTHTTVSDFTQTTTTYRIGARYNSGAAGLYTLTGFFSDVRFTKGLARYTANFTPPSAALDG